MSSVKNKKLLLSTLIVGLLLLLFSSSVFACGNLSSVSLFLPNDNFVTGDDADNVLFQGLWSELATPPMNTDCRLELYDSNSLINYTSDNTDSIRSTLTSYPVNKDSFLLFYDEGHYEWNVGCWANISNVCQLVYATENRSITFDFSGPSITLDSSNDGNVFATSDTLELNYTVEDTYDNGTFTCSLYVDNNFQNSHDVDNGTADSFSYVESSAGFYSWHVVCQDNNGNNQNSTTQTFVIDDDFPIISIDSPVIDETITDNNVVLFNYTVTDGYDSNSMTCDIYVDDEIVNTSDVPNGTITQYNHTFDADGTYDFYIECVDPTGNVGQTSTQTITLSVGPEEPITWFLPVATNDSWLEIIGYTAKPDTINLTIANDDYPSQKTNSTSTDSTSYTNLLGNLTVSQIYNSSFFRVEDNLEGNLSIGTYLKFAGHNFINFIYYAISDVIPVLDYFKISIDQNMNQTVTIGENISIYDYNKPSGWFNVSIELYPGINNVTLRGSQSGISGVMYSEEVIYDTNAPQYNLTNLTGLQNTSSIELEIIDEYNISLETLYVNITASDNASDFVIYTAETTTYNATPIDGNMTCINLSLNERKCNFTHQLIDGTYNITFNVQDSFGHLNKTIITNYTIKSQVEPVMYIEDQGVTTSDVEIYVNWTGSSDDYLDHYELSVGTALDVANIVAWFSLETNYSNYTIDHSNLTYADWYFVNIRAVDTLGRFSETISTDGITIEDNSVPTNDIIQLVADTGTTWVNGNSDLNIEWIFIDNETDIISYEYGIGTNTYPSPGWDNEVGITSTIQTNFTEAGLTLEDGVTYYVSAKARNSNLFGGNRWSGWYSSAGVTVDTEPPLNGYFLYNGGSVDVSYVDMTFLVGNDTVSGISRATILSRKAELIDGSCSFSSVPDYKEELNATIIGSMTPQNYTFSNLENGYCYRFALDVYDHAGNSVRYGTNQISTVKMDFTPPSMVEITDTGFITASTDMYFEWTPAEDNESMISYYEYSLGTSVGAINVINWTNNSLSRTLSLGSSDYESGHLADEEIYYLSVRAWNAHNTSLYSQSSSDGILYFDFEVPSPLIVLSVAHDNTDDGWYDNTSEENISVILQGESGLACVWSFYDVDYIDATESYVEGCTEIPGNNTYYNCTLTDITQGIYDISVACQDQAGNKQTSTSNTDFELYKDNILPTITILSPLENVLPADELFFVVEINESTPYNLEVYIYNYTSGDLLDVFNYGTLTLNRFEEQFDFTGALGEFEFVFVANDSYGNQVNDSLYFIINDGEPLAVMNFTGGYVTETQNINLRSYFYNNITASIYNDSGLISIFHESNIDIQNKTEYNITIDVSTLDEGNYTFEVILEDETKSFIVKKLFTVDTIYPYYVFGSFEEEPIGTIYEDDEIILYSVWNTDLDEATTYLTHNASGTFENISVTTVPMGFVVYPNMIRYKAVIDSSSLLSGTNFTYNWVSYDVAGNTNISTDQTIIIENRAPNISGETIFEGLEGENFMAFVDFTDEDNSQNSASYFDCTDTSSDFETIALSNTLCMINWTNPTAGLYSFSLIVFDKRNGTILDDDIETINITIFPSTAQTVDVDANTVITLNYFLDGELITTKSSYASEDLLITVPAAASQTVELSATDEVIVSATNVSVAVPADVLVRKLNVVYIKNETMNIGPNYKYIPYSAYTLKMNYSTSDDYNVIFPYSDYSVIEPTKLEILKFEYDNIKNEINYSTLTRLTTTIDNITEMASAYVASFSAFILVENWDFDNDGVNYTLDCRDDEPTVYPNATEICSDFLDNDCDGIVDEGCPTCFDNIQNQGEEDVDCGGPCGACPPPPSSGGSSSSSGGSSGFIFAMTEPTCFDGVQNAAETGVDCGGICVNSCDGIKQISTEPSYCSNSLQDFDEEGIDCGGSCEDICVVEEIQDQEVLMPTGFCTDGIKNQDEEKVDCGGSCEACLEPVQINPIEEKPSPIDDSDDENGSSVILFVFLGVMMAGGIVFFVVRSRSLDLFDSSSQNAVAGKISLTNAATMADDDIASIARYVEEQQEKDHTTLAIKDHLVNHGYSSSNIDGALDALLKKDYLETVQNYLGKYGEEGFSDEELQGWLMDKGIDSSVVAVAMDRHKRSK